MSQYDTHSSHPGGPQDPFAAPQKKSNPLGLAGFILSLTCILSPIGFLLSLVGLTKEPRGFAIAGAIIGLVLSIVLGAGVARALWVFNQPQIQWQNEVLNDYIRMQAAIDDNGSTPDSLTPLNVPSEVTTDPWGNAYVYETTDAGDWSLTTYGPDGQPDTTDDLTLKSGLNPFGFAFAFNDIQTEWMTAAENMTGDSDADGNGDADNSTDADDGEGDGNGDGNPTN
jgi:hypothetical protein